MVFPCEIPNQGSQFASLCLPGSQKSVPSVLVPTPCLPTSAETRCGQPRDLLCPVDFSRQALCIQLPAQHPSPGCTTKEVNLRDHRREPPLHPQRTHKALGVALGDLYNPMSLPSTPDDFGDLQIIRSIHLSTSTVKRVQAVKLMGSKAIDHLGNLQRCLTPVDYAAQQLPSPNATKENNLPLRATLKQFQGTEILIVTQ
ncbi:uncharacterized protein LOC128627364 isoform X2 [Artibeus jamaicensis]|uniref:uncharacterized protein LOC128627364 isoform X2 n=1 Tax=Artibeus jamaicensis TaxID=9417 RepID=UPI00235AAF2D|nr:uncharacterized protein LOC128627364 isoform X2 [Artibeus jamaicensis]